MGALIPKMEWTDSIKPLKPFAEFVSVKDHRQNVVSLHIKKNPSSRPIKLFIVYKFDKGQSITKAPGNILKVVPASSEETVALPSYDRQANKLAVSCIDLANNESELYIIEK